MHLPISSRYISSSHTQGGGGVAESFAFIIAMIAVELGLYASIIFAVFAVDDLIMDALWLLKWRRAKSITTITPPTMRFAVFVPAWNEAAVIGAMLHTLCERWPWPCVTIFVGAYPNDNATQDAVRSAMAHDPRIHLLVGAMPGPTTKGANLNQMWHTVLSACGAGRFAEFDAVILHDAEDMVDPLELHAFADVLNTADFAQIPVAPLHRRSARWIGGHYADEFAVAHRRDFFVRAAIGAPVPLAGAGCAVRWAWLEALSDDTGPFAADSLTEDYELGIRLSVIGARGALARYRHGLHRVTSRAYFPASFAAAVRQKARWLLGNALNGWDRLGWVAPPNSSLRIRIASGWMLWRDRRSLLSALAVLMGYGVALLIGIAFALSPHVVTLFAAQELFFALCTFNLLNLVWRISIRVACNTRDYGPVQGLISVLRIPVSNIVLVWTAVRAVQRYRRGRRGAPQVWDKTDHEFPSDDALFV